MSDTNDQIPNPSAAAHRVLLTLDTAIQNRKLAGQIDLQNLSNAFKIFAVSLDLEFTRLHKEIAELKGKVK
jgi:hypothetical protein